jgi:hypothetical protein
MISFTFTIYQVLYCGCMSMLKSGTDLQGTVAT